MRRIKAIDAIVRSAESTGLRRSLGAGDLVVLGIGSVIGTGIFILVAEAAQRAGPAMMLSFVIAGVVCVLAGLCYAEVSSMVPVSGSAYTYSYAMFGEIVAWVVGWALVAEYAIAASAVSVGWSKYLVSLLEHEGLQPLDPRFTVGPLEGGLFNVPAAIVALLVGLILCLGARTSAKATGLLVIAKLAVLAMFFIAATPHFDPSAFHPFAPLGVTGISAASASIFFAYLGFDAVSTAAEETRNPQRNVPLGLLGALAASTAIYILVAAAAIGALGAQPVLDATGVAAAPGTREFAEACRTATASAALACSDDALAHVLRVIGHPDLAAILAGVVFAALPSVILVMMFGQTRIFFAMSRDGLLPGALARVSASGTPLTVTIITAMVVAAAAGLLPIGRLANLANSGTLVAFAVVSAGALMLRRWQPQRPRPFKVPGIAGVAPLSILGCLYLLASLDRSTLLAFSAWVAIGIATYIAYGRRRSPFAKLERPVVPEDGSAAMD